MLYVTLNKNIWSTFADAAYGNEIKPTKFADEGLSVKLSCSYSSADYLYWYRQYPGSAPQFIMLISDGSKQAQESNVDSRFTARVTKERKSCGSDHLFCCCIRLCSVLLRSGAPQWQETQEHCTKTWYTLLHLSNTWHISNLPGMCRGGGGGCLSTCPFSPWCPKCPFVKAIFYFFILFFVIKRPFVKACPI